MPQHITVHRQGETIQFTSRFDSNVEAANTLVGLTLSGQPLARNDFAVSLARTWGRSRRLSERQWPWVHRLVWEHENPPVVEPPTEAVSLVELVNMLVAAAGSGLSRPEIAVTVGGVEVRFKYRTGTGRTSIVETPAGSSFERFIGYIERDGTLAPFRHSPLSATAAALALISEMPRGDLIEYIAENGRRGGRCQFCRRPLSTAESLTAGYGPVCADRFGLPWGRVSTIGTNSARAIELRSTAASPPANAIAEAWANAERISDWPGSAVQGAQILAHNDPRSADERRNNPADADDEWI